ncbi:MFS transporter [Demequina sp. NBRC 110053]|uniref:MFS transporter n=1 Tax=Demequina sp. NBRC 110053 TaxID=1570342 RepID=UPI000A002C64|nr:MFS transporter [Demequina sp. NBRC 110053]
MSAPAPSGPPGVTDVPREQRLILWIAILASFVSFLDGTIVNVALPAIVDELGGGITTQQWTVDAYLLTLGAFILVAGSVSDTYGRIRVIRWGLVGFAVTSILIALAPSAPVLIAARLLQGVAGAMLVPSSLALITSNFRGAAQAKAIGTWTGLTSAAMVAGPIIGGLFVDLASWRLAFLINVVPIGVTLWMLARLEQRDVRRDDARVDYLGAFLCVVGLGGVVFALIEEPNLGWGSPLVWLPGVVGALSLAGFLWWQARARAPMLPLSLFTVRNFAWGNLATWLVYGALSLNGFVIVVYLQEEGGLSATVAGLTTLPITILMILLSSRMGALAGQWGPRLFMTAGPAIMAVGALMMLLVREDLNVWRQLMPGVVVFGFGLTVTVSPLTAAILGAIEPERSGIASATNNAVSRIAGLIAIAGVAAIVGGELDLDGFHRAMIATAVAMALGGLVSWLGIRNPAPPAEAA